MHQAKEERTEQERSQLKNVLQQRTNIALEQKVGHAQKEASSIHDKRAPTPRAPRNLLLHAAATCC